MTNYKKYAILMCSIGLFLLLVGVTYSFFNYTRTGNANNFSVGRISFVTNQSSTINLSNVFPIDSNNINTDTDNVGIVVVTITGDTDLDKGIEYLVSSQDTNLTTQSGTLVPLSLNVTASGLGDSESDYYTERTSATSSIYKKLIGSELIGDQMLLVGYIAPNDPLGTPDGIDGSVTIKAYFDKDKILITDTPEESAAIAGNRTILSTSEWGTFNSNGVSFKVKVEANEGIWVNGSLEDIMKKNAVMDNISSTFVSASTGIDFGAISSDTNGKGVYTRAGTENDPYPIVYYRGDVTDNNVLFNNKCWKAVRTTDTGGVKLIYNGVLKEETITTPITKDVDYIVEEINTPYDGYGWVYDSENNVWQSEGYGTTYSSYLYNAGLTIRFTNVGNYAIKYDLYDYDSSLTILEDDSYLLYGTTDTQGLFILNDVGTSNNITINSYSNHAVYGKIEIVSIRNETTSSCDNTGLNSFLNMSGTTNFAFNTIGNSPAHAGYMYGDVYTSNLESPVSEAYFGSGFTYENGEYKLINASYGRTSNRHYTCNLTTPEGTCATIRFYFYRNYYVNLTGGESIEIALEKMQRNTNNSNAKTIIDSWYSSNMTSVTNELEDIIWCNDRSIGIGNNNGWLPNGDTDTQLYFGATQRSNYATNSSTVKNQPSLACTNKNDSFTVNNIKGNQKLTYPVALLTEDEMVLAGGVSGIISNSYLNDGDYWSMSPDYYEYNEVYMFTNRSNSIGHFSASSGTFGLRPAISIKPGQLITKGTGTATDPYVIR